MMLLLMCMPNRTGLMEHPWQRQDLKSPALSWITRYMLLVALKTVAVLFLLLRLMIPLQTSGQPWLRCHSHWTIQRQLLHLLMENCMLLEAAILIGTIYPTNYTYTTLIITIGLKAQTFLV